MIHPLLREELLLRRDGDKRIVPIKPVIRSNSTRLLRGACIAGAGILLLTTISAWREVAAGRLMRLLEDWRTVDIGLSAVFPHRRHLAGKVRAFVDFLAARLGGDAARDPWWERIEAARGAPAPGAPPARRNAPQPALRSASRV